MSDTVLHATDADFADQVLASDQPVLVDFWAPWCMPCRMFGPVLDKVAKETEGAAHVVKVNIDEEPELASRYGVMSIPTVILFKDGKEIARKVGAQSTDVYTDLLDANL